MFAVLPQGHGVRPCFPEAPSTPRTMLLRYYLGGIYVSSIYTLRYRHIFRYIHVHLHAPHMDNELHGVKAL